jgi:hypothetical protein
VTPGRRVLGPVYAHNVQAAALSEEQQRAVGLLREEIAMYDRLIDGAGVRASRRNAESQRERLARVGIFS